MPLTRNLKVQKDLNVRYDPNGGDERNGKDQHLRIGRKGDHRYKAYLNIDQDWSNVRQIVSAVLHLRMSNAHVSWGSSPRILLRRVTEDWTEGTQGENVWDNWTYTDYGAVTTSQYDVPITFVDDGDLAINITRFFEYWAPKTVAKRSGDPGRAGADKGFLIRAYNQDVINDACEFYSKDWTGLSAYKPYVVLTYEPVNYPPTLTNLSPFGNQAKVDNFTGTVTDLDAADKLKATHIELYDVGGTKLWDQTLSATSSEQAASAYSVPIPELVLLETTYEYRVRVQDSRGMWSAWTGKTSFTFVNSPPTLTLGVLGSYETLSGVAFRGEYSDSNGHPMGAFRIQLRTTTAPGDPLWDGNTNLWDTSDVPPTAEEIAGNYFSRPYGGQALTPATYSWRAKVADKFGSQSSWQYGTVTLTQAWNPDPGIIDFVTGYQKRALTRIVLRGMDGERGPVDPPVAIIEDAANIGASTYLNSPGEFYMTLPATHPQVSVCEPYQTHYAVEVWHGDRWRTSFAGLLTDFDATEDDVVFYGVDYLGLLDMVIDQRWDKEHPDKPYTQGGSKYSDVTLTTAIVDQLNTARAKTDSPVGFIDMGVMQTFSEKVTIFSTFTQVGSFIRGLIDSHRQGTGKRSRLQVRKNAAGTGYEFVLLDDPGVDRLNMRMEYGGLVQGFRLTAFGDFGTFTHSLGRTKTGTNVMYKSEQAPGIPPATWGRIERVNVFMDVYDENDLIRRTKQAAASAGRVGKRIAMGLRTDAVLPFDGYDIGDNLPIHIKRGVVDTTNYGSGLWSLLGVEWRVYPDGHSETTLVVLPKEDGVAPDPNLIPTLPILDGREWEIGYVPPVQGVNVGKLYLDLTTGITYILQPDGTYAVLDSPSQIAPPTGLTITTAMTTNEAGLPIVKLTVTVTQPTGTAVRGTWVEVTSTTDGASPPNPVWTDSTLLFIPVGETTASIEGVTGGIQYFARAWAVDFVGVPSTVTAHEVQSMATDTAAPGMPQAFTLQAAVEGFFAGWDKATVKDLDYYEMRYAVDDGSGTGVGGTPDWVIARAKTNFAFIGGLVPEQKYWAQLRAVDTSGNVEDNSTPPPVTVKAASFEDAGYTALVAVTPVKVGTDLLETGIITDDHIIPGGLSAQVLKTGTLYVSTTETNMLDGIRVRSNGVDVGLWNETGLYIYEETNPSNYVRVFDAGITVFRNGVPTTAITPDGIDATAITLGALPGGNNVIRNSGFELVNFSVATTVDTTWTAAADWNTTRVGSDTNVDTNANDLDMTGATY